MKPSTYIEYDSEDWYIPIGRGSDNKHRECYLLTEEEAFGELI